MSILAKIFKSKPPAKQALVEKDSDLPSEFIRPCLAGELLALPRRQKLLAHIWQRTSVSREQFDLLYMQPIERYAALVQQFPASEAHHHAYPGGLLDHGLEIIAYALKLRQSYLLPIGSTPEEQAAQSEIWTACTAYAALLHDIGKIAVDLYVEYEDGSIWHPWNGPLTRPYRFKYNANREYRLHTASSGLLYSQILGSQILDWLSQTPTIWSSLLYILSGHFEHAGVLGDIVTKADQSSVAQELGGDPAKAMSAPKHALQRKLLDGLRYLIKEELKLNNTGPSDGWLTDDALWLVSKTVSDKLRAHLLSMGVSGIPSKNSAIFDVLQEHGIIQANGDKAIWSATVKAETGWGNKFTFLKVSPSLIWDANDKPDAFSGLVIIENEAISTEATEETKLDFKAATDSTETIEKQTEKADSLDAVLDILGIEEVPEVIPEIDNEGQANKTDTVKEVITSPPFKKHTFKIEPVEQNQDVAPSGEHFIEWLKDAILNRKLIMNDAKAFVHTVDDTIFIATPGIFMRFAQEFPKVQALAKQAQLQDWLYVQRQFEKQRVHKKQLNGLNIWNCKVTGPRKTKQVSGYLFADPKIILPEISFNNPYLKILNNDKNKQS